MDKSLALSEIFQTGITVFYPCWQLVLRSLSCQAGSLFSWISEANTRLMPSLTLYISIELKNGAICQKRQLEINRNSVRYNFVMPGTFFCSSSGNTPFRLQVMGWDSWQQSANLSSSLCTSFPWTTSMHFWLLTRSFPATSWLSQSEASLAMGWHRRAEVGTWLALGNWDSDQFFWWVCFFFFPPDKVVQGILSKYPGIWSGLGSNCLPLWAARIFGKCWNELQNHLGQFSHYKLVTLGQRDYTGSLHKVLLWVSDDSTWVIPNQPLSVYDFRVFLSWKNNQQCSEDMPSSVPRGCWQCFLQGALVLGIEPWFLPENICSDVSCFL